MPERLIPQKSNDNRTAVFIDLKLMDYSSAFNLQTQTVQAKIQNFRHPDTLFFVEHPKVFTLGRRGGRENLVVSESFLEQKNIKIVQTDRGGNITFHGPGQAVLYPIVDLEKNRIGVKDFVHGLEEIMKQTARFYGIMAERDKRNHGLWVRNAKIGSIGISVKRGISSHGLALNISPDLTPFSWINPCGLNGVSMTSVKNETPDQIKKTTGRDCMRMVKKLFIKHFASTFDFKIAEVNKNENQT